MGAIRGNVRTGLRWVAAAAALIVGGCAADLPLDTEGDDQASGPFAALSLPELGTLPKPVRGTPTEIYTRIARGAVTCWFGADGPLKGTHVYHAEAKPPSKGGQARIVIHKLDASRQDLRGSRAYAIDIIPEGNSAKLRLQNATLGEPRGTDMANDVRRWASGDEGCVPEPLTAGWGTDPDKKTGAAAAKKTQRK